MNPTERLSKPCGFAEQLWETLASLLCDPEWVLAHFPLVADLTALRDDCRFASSRSSMVARYNGLPFIAISFFGKDPREVADLAARLVEPEEVFFILSNGEQLPLVRQAFFIGQSDPEWQMLFVGIEEDLSQSEAVPLTTGNLDDMRQLAASTELMALEKSPFQQGPAFGLWDDGLLVAMGCTHLQIPGAAEIGSIATRSTHRRRGFARHVTTALLRAHLWEGRRVFLMVFEANRVAVRLYESLGFKCVRPMFLLRCRLRAHVGVQG